MEMTMCLPLLLLICSPSTAPLLQTESDNDIIPHGKQTESQGREPTNASDLQNTCTPDIHSVLREMSISLAEQRVEIRHLQRENEAQAVRLRELELQETEVDKLKQQLQAQAAELITMKARTNVTEKQSNRWLSQPLCWLQAQELLDHLTHTPLWSSDMSSQTLEMPTTQTQVFFIAPVRGAYHFEFYIGAHGHASHPSSAALVKNGVHVFIAYEHQTSHYGSSANGVTLRLEVGDVVFLRLWVNSRMFDSEYHHSTFSGHLLFTM